MKKLLLFTACLLPALALFAQRTITGKVTDETGKPIPKASVQVTGGPWGTSTDDNGFFRLADLPASAVTMVITSINYQPLTVALTASRSSYEVSLRTSDVKMDEVVVVAYGTAKRKTFTGSVSNINSADISKQQVSTISRAFDGLIPGVQVASASGQPGSGQALVLRGVGSFSLATAPLWVVDGVPYNGDINAINPADVESISVQKGATATSLYGSRATNGVIIVTTKRGKGKPKFELQARAGINDRSTSEYDVIRDPATFLELYWLNLKHEAMFRVTNPLSEQAAGQFASGAMFGAGNGRLDRYQQYSVPAGQFVIDPSTGKLNSNANLLYYDDWEDIMIDRRSRQEYIGTLSGSSDKTTYLISAGYLNDEGIAIKTGFERLTARVNIENNLNKWLRFGLGTNYSRSEQFNTQDAANANASYQNMFFWTRNVSPAYPVWVRDASGNFKLDARGNRIYDFGSKSVTDTNSMGTRRFSATDNPRATLDLDERNRTADNVNARTFIELRPIENLTVTLNYTLDYLGSRTTTNQNLLYGVAGIGGGQVNVQGRGTIANFKSRTELTNQLVNYKRTFGNAHNFEVLGGHESYKLVNEASTATKEVFMIPGMSEHASAARVTESQTGETNHAIESYFTRLQYDFKNKFLASGSFRRDGSSRFHSDNRWGSFWSVGVGYVLSEESFIRKAGFVNYLKVKAGYGTTGNEGLLYPAGTANPNGINYYPYINQYVVNTTGTPNILLDYRGNKNITWENNENLDIGLEGTIFRKLQFSFEYYSRNISDMLFNVPVALSTGVQFETRNSGTINIKGFEFDLNYTVVQTRDLRWSIGLNGNHYNTITKELPEEFTAQGYLPRGRAGLPGGNFRIAIDKDPYEYFTWAYGGADPSNGLALYYRDELGANGVATGKRTLTADWSTATRYYTGKSAIPDVTGGINTTLRYREFDFSAIAAYGLGGWTFDVTYQGLMSTGNNDITTWHKDMLKSWTTSNPNTTVPRLSENYTNGNATSDRFLIKSDFFALRNITFGYTVPTKTVEKYGLTNIRAYVVADNVFLQTRRQGLDVRQNFTGGTFNGYPPVRTISFGLNIGL
ncbi:MAG: SusC/RagA family TonB-linked outer membrane protein [Chitinophagaceae bacterium]|nr:SusC/RagA family TonB-linked outer membrane protein [Chitinophagaceae bacterium]